MNKMFNFAAAAILVALTACTQMPTEKVFVVDMRPQISFKALSENSEAARVVVDGNEVGFVRDFVDGKNALRVLPGNHLLQVVSNSGVVLEERFYIGDGVARAFTVR
ncbi:MAG TPA: hypothetical protein VL381_02680 [Rhodocyclaceae bacterium]|nr:hypothetical protein [Rhodocyclaceae bacterium]